MLGLPYDQAVDMWSFGCILAELVTGRPLFPAYDERELLEYFIIRIGMPPEEMINKCNKRNHFFDGNRCLIRSKHSRIPRGSRERSNPIRRALQSEDDDDFIDFIEVSKWPRGRPRDGWMTRLLCAAVPRDRPGEAPHARPGAEAQLDPAQQGPVHV